MNMPAIPAASIGQRVRMLRLANGLSQTQLAEAVGLSATNSHLSKIENGQAQVDDWLLSSFARVLAVDEALLQTTPTDALATRPWLRAFKDASARRVESVVADNLLVHETAARLRLRRVNADVPAFDGDLNDDEDIENFALEVRAAAGVDEGAPVNNVMRAAERLGCVVLPLDDEVSQRHFGMSHFIDGLPYIRVARSRTIGGATGIPGDRQRFTVAHEVGHLALHAGTRPPDSSEEARRIERQAHRFAAAFLVPADALVDDLERHGRRVDLATLAQLKATWGVAIKALVMRFRHLDVIGDDQATSLYKLISKRGWTKSEPVAVPNESARWLTTALQKLGGDDVDPIAAAVAASGVHDVYWEQWLSWDEVPGADIVHLPVPRDPARAAGREARGTAEVHQLRL